MSTSHYSQIGELLIHGKLNQVEILRVLGNDQKYNEKMQFLFAVELKLLSQFSEVYEKTLLCNIQPKSPGFSS